MPDVPVCHSEHTVICEVLLATHETALTLAVKIHLAEMRLFLCVRVVTVIYCNLSYLIRAVREFHFRPAVYSLSNKW